MNFPAPAFRTTFRPLACAATGVGLGVKNDDNVCCCFLLSFDTEAVIGAIVLEVRRH